MAIEIERRFLVDDPEGATAAYAIVGWGQFRQGYFGRVGGFNIRIRAMCDAQGNRSAILTCKTRRQGMCREEYEHPLDLDAAEYALGCLPSAQIIRKRRYRIRYRDGFVWSVDRFEGLNAGLVIAELELSHPGQYFQVPHWAGKEVTFDRRYGNSALAQTPISNWSELGGRSRSKRQSNNHELLRWNLIAGVRAASPSGPI